MPTANLPPLAAYLRIASVAIALFDFLATFPGELRLYSRQTSITRLSKACWMFIGIRYVTIAALVTSTVGFFGSGFSKESCHHFHLVAPILKLLATLISQIIISTRAYAVSRANKGVLLVLLLCFALTLPPEILGNAVGRIPLQNAVHNCTSGNSKNAQFAWLHYLAAMLFDTIAMSITLWYLVPTAQLFRRRSITRQPGTFTQEGTTGVNSLSRLLLKEGILYFIALTAVNILNLIFFRLDNVNLQSGAATLGQAVTMIFSEKFILEISEHVHGTSFSRSETRGVSQLRRNTGMTPRAERFELSGIQVTTEVEVAGGDHKELSLVSPSYSSPSPHTPHSSEKLYWGHAA